jgi:hypothetical protein
MVPPPKDEFVLFGKRVFVDIIKNLKMRSPWINQMCPKFNDM